MAGICDTCHAGCCRTYNLLITAYDAMVISQDLKLPIAEFVTFLAVPLDKAESWQKSQTPILATDANHENSRFFLMLKRVESPLIQGTLKCYFLQEWKREEPVMARGEHPGATIAGRCGIYGSRPLMCRTFPSSLHNGFVGLITSPQPTELEKQHSIYRICPEKWDTNTFTQNPTEAMHRLVLNNFEQDFQNRAIAEWNKTPGPIKNYLPYMMSAYGNRFRLGDDLITPTPAIQIETDTIRFPG